MRPRRRPPHRRLIDKLHIVHDRVVELLREGVLADRFAVLIEINDEVLILVIDHESVRGDVCRFAILLLDRKRHRLDDFHIAVIEPRLEDHRLFAKVIRRGDDSEVFPEIRVRLRQLRAEFRHRGLALRDRVFHGVLKREPRFRGDDLQRRAAHEILVEEREREHHIGAAARALVTEEVTRDHAFRGLGFGHRVHGALDLRLRLFAALRALERNAFSFRHRGVLRGKREILLSAAVLTLERVLRLDLRNHFAGPAGVNDIGVRLNE